MAYKWEAFKYIYFNRCLEEGRAETLSMSGGQRGIWNNGDLLQLIFKQNTKHTINNK